MPNHQVVTPDNLGPEFLMGTETPNKITINVDGVTLIKNPTTGEISVSALAAGIDKNYIHNQITPSAVWMIPHNLGKYPAIDVMDTAGNHYTGCVRYIDLNTVEISFSAPFSGQATLN